MKKFNKAIGAMLIFSLTSSSVFEAHAQAPAPVTLATKVKTFAARQAISFSISNFGFMAGMSLHTVLLSFAQNNDALRWGVLDTYTDMEKLTTELGSLTAFSMGATVGGKGIALTQYLLPKADHAFYSKFRLISPAVLAYKNMSKTRVGHYGMAIGSLTNNMFGRYWHSHDWGQDKIYLEELGHWSKKFSEIENKIDSKNWEILGYKTLGIRVKQQQSEIELQTLLAEKQQIETKLAEYREKTTKLRDKIWSDAMNITLEDSKEMGVHVAQLLITVELLDKLRSGGSAVLNNIRAKCTKPEMHQTCFDVIRKKVSEQAARLKPRKLPRAIQVATNGGAKVFKVVSHGGKKVLLSVWANPIVPALANSIWHAIQFLETERHVRDAWEKTVSVENFKRKITDSYRPFGAALQNVKLNITDETITRSLEKNNASTDDQESEDNRSVAERIKDERDSYYEAAFGEASKAISIYNKLWEEYREKIIKAEYNFHHMQWQNYFETKYVEMVKTKQYLRWLARGAKLDDEIFKNSSREALNWHHSPDDVSSFSKEKSKYYNLHRAGTNNFDVKKTEEYLVQYEKNVIADLEKTAIVMKQQISEIVRGTFYTNTAGILTRLASPGNRLALALGGPLVALIKSVVENDSQSPLNLVHSYRTELKGLNEILATIESKVEGKALLNNIKSIINRGAGAKTQEELKQIQSELNVMVNKFAMLKKINHVIRSNHAIKDTNDFKNCMELLNGPRRITQETLKAAHDSFNAAIGTAGFDAASENENAFQELEMTANNVDLGQLSTTEREEMFLMIFASHALGLVNTELELPNLEQIIYKPIQAIQNAM